MGEGWLFQLKLQRHQRFQLSLNDISPRGMPGMVFGKNLNGGKFNINKLIMGRKIIFSINMNKYR
jgi:hypothetical protein